MQFLALVCGLAAVSLRNADEEANAQARVRRLLLCLLAATGILAALGYWRVLACMLVLLVGSYAVLRFRKSRALERIRLNVHEGAVEQVDVDHEPMCVCVCVCVCMCLHLVCARCIVVCAHITRTIHCCLCPYLPH